MIPGWLIFVGFIILGCYMTAAALNIPVVALLTIVLVVEIIAATLIKATKS